MAPYLTARQADYLSDIVRLQNVMAATYPEMFQAAIVYSGTPAGCFYSQSGGVDQWNNSCAQGQVRSSPQVWLKMVQDMVGLGRHEWVCSDRWA